jgi:ElaB/YqjD/DUF883 family membrane-anchored ribosome-binding protein
MNDTAAAVQKDKLMTDLRTVIADAEELLRITAGSAAEGSADLRQRVQERLAHAKANLAHLQDTAIEKAKAVGHATDDYVHDHPWKAVGMAAGVGLIVGLLIGRR